MDRADLDSLSERLRRRRWSRAYARFYAELRSRGVRLDVGVSINPKSRIVGREISIGAFTRFRGPVVMKGHGSISIGRYCAFGSDVRLVSTTHETFHANLQSDLQKRLGLGRMLSAAPIRVGHNVWVGDAALILGGLVIGDGAIVGAGAVVTNDVDAFGVVGGVPARRISDRFDHDVVEALQEIAWWDWDPDRIERNRAFFAADLRSLDAEAVRRLVEP